MNTLGIFIVCYCILINRYIYTTEVEVKDVLNCEQQQIKKKKFCAFLFILSNRYTRLKL